ncbi:MAG: efflux RND transporter periplasmic adaptor subunit [Myxococcota bacterium]|nr:efflux RND transporter periplasmic adaptor subunit [Myxococcota bacterium]
MGVLHAQTESLPVQLELPGRVEAVRTAQVRARVTGVVLERSFEEGEWVEQGQVLYRIDPAPMQAALAQAKAQVSVAQANLQLAQSTAQRLEPLAGTKAVSAQTLDDARAAEAQARASLELAKAQAQSAALDLQYATVRAPISGRIGRGLVTEGALVSAGELTPMASIVQLDPVYVNLSVPVAELRALRAQSGTSLEQEQGAQVTLSDGDWQYAHTGSLLFTDVSVDPQTGSTLIRASFPNPDAELLPGMFVRGSVQGQRKELAVSLPEEVIQRSGGESSVIVVQDGVAKQRSVQVRRTVGTQVVVQGLESGDAVVTDGFQKLTVGQPVTAVEVQAQAEAPQTPTVAQAEE